jgi:N-acetylglucosaminyldiphosphoundecaprenol N-acetyl-beta-D-mannosaminyltransferase
MATSVVMAHVAAPHPAQTSAAFSPAKSHGRGHAISYHARVSSSTLWHPAFSSIQVLGVRVDNVTEAEALDAAAQYIAAGGPHRVVTPNPEIVMSARRSPDFRRILNESDLALPDGVGLLLAAALAGSPLRAHVRGTDFVLALAQRSVSQGWRWFLLGAAPGVAEMAATALATRFPGLAIAGSAPGSPHAEADAATRGVIGRAGPVDVLLVAYGAPWQERWIARNQEAVAATVQIGVGGVFNYLAGRAPRAPAWARRLELEWAHRLMTEPWRWRRQLALPGFALLATAEALHRRAGRR